ncbi:M42 family metallopeptidase [Congzhengia sp.]|uniref:M42 family metallopeptidase n=1 Tax=Congzhengia sp. TaxID=2944168 RepID=UPI00307819CD
MYLKELTDLPGVSGDEGQVRAFIADKMQNLCDELVTDSIGNLICLKKGTDENPKRLMVCAHMDEVGLICSRITDDGFIKFKCVGGIDTRVLVSKKVRIGRRLISGVIGAKAIHLQEKEEREQVPKVTDLYIDIGAKDKAEAEKHVSVGDYCVFDSEFVEFGSGFIKAKALDDRLGCACLMSLAEERFAFDLYLVFTVQEEVGLRGARVAAERIRPDAAIVLEGTTCSDVYGTDEKDYSTISGGGAALSILDRGTYYDKELTNALYATAKQHEIPVQFKQTASGGNDAGAIHTAAGGVKTAAISVPARYIHSPSSVVNKSDYEALKALIHTFLKEGFCK